MPALISRPDQKFSPLKHVSLVEVSRNRQEKWLQELLFNHPETIPIKDVDPASTGFIPICRELGIPKVGGATTFLDLLGMTPEAKLVLIECKLWRNPQARREVIAQALEYASLLRKWSYNDLSMKLRKLFAQSDANPLYNLYKDAGGTLSEPDFHDRIARGLRAGDFVVIIAGDGIREDVHAITEHLNQHSGMASKLALAEFKIYESEAGETIVIPLVPVRTELLVHRVYIGQNDLPLNIEQETQTAPLIDNASSSKRAVDQAFWQSFIDSITFDHPDQPGPKRGGFGWVKIPMPEPISHLTAYRTVKGEAGIFFRLKGNENLNLYEEICAAKQRLEEEIGSKIVEKYNNDDPFDATFEIKYEGNPFNENDYKSWLITYSNNAVSTLRPFFSHFS